ncbi:MAG: molecular chaperone [Candidatus Zixiibacteriota bacterium]|nr:MAG: molecular chaperone [candidate division Zixibacteria bacterium]
MRQSSDTPRCSNRARLRGFLVFGVLLIAPLLDLAAGVLVAPTVVFLSDHQRTGRMTVQNPTDKPQEVGIRFSFGLPESDSLGNVHVSLSDSNVTDPHSAIDWIKAFPRKVVVPPGATQIVRFVANPPADLANGEYWARIVVRAQDAEVAIPEASEEGAITTQLNMVMQTAIMLKYRNGDLLTQIEVTNVDVETDSTGESVSVTVDMVSRGTASYVGMLNCRLLDADKREISKTTTQLAVYHDLRRRARLPITGIDFRKPYQVEVLVTTKGRTDIAAEDMITGNEVLLTQSLE